MLVLENVAYDGEWVMDARGSTIKLRESRKPGSPNLVVRFEVDPPADLDALDTNPISSSGVAPSSRKWRTSSREKTWRYLLREESGEVLYRAAVDDRTVVNTSSGREFDMVYFELEYCGPGSDERRFSASGTESTKGEAVAEMQRIAEQHNSGALPPAEG